MNDLKSLSGNLKRVLIGVLLVTVFLFLYWTIRGSMQHSLGLSSTAREASAPQISLTMGGGGSYGAPLLSRDAAIGNAGYTKGVAYEAGYASDSVLPMPPVPSQTPPSGTAKIVKNGDLSLLVAHVDEAAAQITEIRIKMGGQPGNASFNEYRPGVHSGSITIWVPSERFDEAVAAIKKLALRVERENVGIQDVSAQYVDLESRLKNLKAAEAQYLEIMKRSGKIGEVLEVTRELNNTRAQIEQTQGQLDYLSRQVALSSITVTLSEEASPASVTNEWRPFVVLKAAAKSTLNDLTDFIDMLLVFFVKLPVLLLNIGFWVLIVWLLWKAGHYAFGRLKETISGV